MSEEEWDDLISKSNAEDAVFWNDLKNNKESDDEISSGEVNEEIKNEQKMIEELKQYQKLPSPEMYTPLPLTWEDFQKNESQYLHHPLWDLWSPMEYYQWTTLEEWKEEKRRYDEKYKDIITSGAEGQMVKIISNNVQQID